MLFKFFALLKPACYPVYKSMFGHQADVPSSDESSEDNSQSNYSDSTFNANNDTEYENITSDTDSSDDTIIESMIRKEGKKFNEEQIIKLDHAIINKLIKKNLIRQTETFCGYKFSKNEFADKKNVCDEKEKFCSFCKQNGEPEFKYRSHSLMDKFQQCTCPILQGIVCRICKATGKAHPYPYNKKSNLKQKINQNILNPFPEN